MANRLASVFGKCPGNCAWLRVPARPVSVGFFAGALGSAPGSGSLPGPWASSQLQSPSNMVDQPLPGPHGALFRPILTSQGCFGRPQGCFGRPRAPSGEQKTMQNHHCKFEKMNTYYFLLLLAITYYYLLLLITFIIT